MGLRFFVILSLLCLGCGARGGLSNDPAPDGGTSLPSEYCAEILPTGRSRIRVTRTRGAETIAVVFVDSGPSLPFTDLVSLPEGWNVDSIELNGSRLSPTLFSGATGSAQFTETDTVPVRIDLNFSVDPLVVEDFTFTSNSIPFQDSCP